MICTSAVYGPGRGPAFGSDFQLPYVVDWLRWIGIERIESVEFRRDLVVDGVDARRARAHEEVRCAARSLAGQLGARIV